MCTACIVQCAPQVSHRVQFWCTLFLASGARTEWSSSARCTAALRATSASIAACTGQCTANPCLFVAQKRCRSIRLVLDVCAFGHANQARLCFGRTTALFWLSRPITHRDSDLSLSFIGRTVARGQQWHPTPSLAAHQPASRARVSHC